jgi:DNA-binding response OmpR family regulator
MTCEKPRVLIVDDEQVVCDLLYDELSERGYLCTTVLNANDALTKLAAQSFDVALLDIRLPGISGMEVLAEMRSNHTNTAAIMITAVNDVDTAVEAIKLGASDYIVKPFDVNKISTSIHTALENKKCSPKRDGCKTALCVITEKDRKQADGELFNQINAISRGVEAKLDSLDDRSEMVIQRTIDVARQFGIPEAEIQRWATARARLNSEKKGRIDSALRKLRRSPLAQSILGMTEVHLYTRKSSESQN